MYTKTAKYLTNLEIVYSFIVFTSVKITKIDETTNHHMGDKRIYFINN